MFPDSEYHCRGGVFLGVDGKTAGIGPQNAPRGRPRFPIPFRPCAGGQTTIRRNGNSGCGTPTRPPRGPASSPVVPVSRCWVPKCFVRKVELPESAPVVVDKSGQPPIDAIEPPGTSLGPGPIGLAMLAIMTESSGLRANRWSRPPPTPPTPSPKEVFRNVNPCRSSLGSSEKLGTGFGRCHLRGGVEGRPRVFRETG